MLEWPELVKRRKNRKPPRNARSHDLFVLAHSHHRATVVAVAIYRVPCGLHRLSPMDRHRGDLGEVAKDRVDAI